MATRALAQVYRLDPPPAQRVALARLVGCRRFVYNWALQRRREHHDATGSHLSAAALSAALTQLKRDPDHLWLAEVDNQAVQQALRDLDRAYANFFAKRAQYPRFASKHRGDRTARIPQRVKVDEAAATATVPKVGAVSLRQGRCGDRFVSLRLEASVLVDAPVPPEQARGNAVGIDLGLSTYATLSNGETIANPRHLRSRQRALRRAQRGLSRKQKGSANREKARARLAKLHRKVARQRANFQHKLTTALMRRYDLLRVEDLNIRGLGRTKLARSMYDAAFGELVRQVTYKVAWYGKHLVRVGRFYPSSKTCRACGHVYAGLTLRERGWTCAACGGTHDRDANAARNLLVEGTRLFTLRHAADGQAGGTTTIPTPSSRRDRPRRKTPVNDPSDALRDAGSVIKQESHTLKGGRYQFPVECAFKTWTVCRDNLGTAAHVPHGANDSSLVSHVAICWQDDPITYVVG